MRKTSRRLALMTPLLCGMVWWAAAVAPPAWSAPRGTKGLAAELARLRSEVEALSTQLETQRADSRAKLQSLHRQKAELDAQLRREAVRVAELQRRIDAWKKKVAARADRQDALRPVVTAGAAELKAAVARTLPFQREDRRLEIDKITDRLAKKLLTPADGVGRLWDRVEDELRLSRESGLYHQVIRLGTKEHLVEVARLGMVLMYFRTKDGRYGVARPKGDDWEWTLLPGADAQKQAEKLFESFRKQIRVGFFVLPNALPTAREGGR